MESKTGVVKFFNLDKGFGFIVQDDGEKDAFVHMNACNGERLYENDKVSYQIEQSPKGLSAINVVVL